MIQAEPELGPLVHKETSDTAANAHDPKFGPSGVQPYRVLLGMEGGARMTTVVDAATGDEAAEAGLRKYPGWKVAYVGPASEPDGAPVVDVVV